MVAKPSTPAKKVAPAALTPIPLTVPPVNLADPVPPVAEPDDEPLTVEQINAAAIVPMAHADGGTCDVYPKDDDGNILVPIADIPAMIDHGFAVVYTEA